MAFAFENSSETEITKQIKEAIQANEAGKLKEILEENPDFDLNKFTQSDHSILWWALVAVEKPSNEIIKTILHSSLRLINNVELYTIELGQRYNGLRLFEYARSLRLDEIATTIDRAYYANLEQELRRGATEVAEDGEQNPDAQITDELVEDIANRGQGTHTPIVEAEIEKSIYKLYTRYGNGVAPPSKKQTDDARKKIHDFIHKDNSKRAKVEQLTKDDKYAANFVLLRTFAFDEIEEIQVPSKVPGRFVTLNLSHILYLVTQALDETNPEYLCDGIEIEEKDIESRYYRFIKKFIELAHTYPGPKVTNFTCSCPGGMRNGFISAIDGVAKDIRVLPQNTISYQLAEINLHKHIKNALERIASENFSLYKNIIIALSVTDDEKKKRFLADCSKDPDVLMLEDENYGYQNIVNLVKEDLRYDSLDDVGKENIDSALKLLDVNYQKEIFGGITLPIVADTITAKLISSTSTLIHTTNKLPEAYTDASVTDISNLKKELDNDCKKLIQEGIEQKALINSTVSQTQLPAALDLMLHRQALEYAAHTKAEGLAERFIKHSTLLTLFKQVVLAGDETAFTGIWYESLQKMDAQGSASMSTEFKKLFDTPDIEELTSRIDSQNAKLQEIESLTQELKAKNKIIADSDVTSRDTLIAERNELLRNITRLKGEIKQPLQELSKEFLDTYWGNISSRVLTKLPEELKQWWSGLQEERRIQYLLFGLFELANTEQELNEDNLIDKLGHKIKSQAVISGNISGLSLQGLDLRNADLSGRNLSKCDLSGSDLRGCDLSLVVIDQETNFDGCQFDAKSILSLLKSIELNHRVAPLAKTLFAKAIKEIDFSKEEFKRLLSRIYRENEYNTHSLLRTIDTDRQLITVLMEKATSLLDQKDRLSLIGKIISEYSVPGGIFRKDILLSALDNLSPDEIRELMQMKNSQGDSPLLVLLEFATDIDILKKLLPETLSRADKNQILITGVISTTHEVGAIHITSDPILTLPIITLLGSSVSTGNIEPLVEWLRYGLSGLSPDELLNNMFDIKSPVEIYKKYNSKNILDGTSSFYRLGKYNFRDMLLSDKNHSPEYKRLLIELAKGTSDSPDESSIWSQTVQFVKRLGDTLSEEQQYYLLKSAYKKQNKKDSKNHVASFLSHSSGDFFDACLALMQDAETKPTLSKEDIAEGLNLISEGAFTFINKWRNMAAKSTRSRISPPLR